MSRRIRRSPINVENIKAFRARGVSYEQISRTTGYSRSAIWRALNEPEREAVSVPAGRQRSVYLSDGDWEEVGLWAQERGTSRSRILAAMIGERIDFRRHNDPLGEA